MNHTDGRRNITDALAEGRILVLDGAMGTMLQRLGLGEDDFRRGAFSGHGRELKGDNECLNLARPDAVRQIHEQYIAAGADIIRPTRSAQTAWRRPNTALAAWPPTWPVRARA